MSGIWLLVWSLSQGILSGNDLFALEPIEGILQPVGTAGAKSECLTLLIG